MSALDDFSNRMNKEIEEYESISKDQEMPIAIRTAAFHVVTELLRFKVEVMQYNLGVKLI
jgi:uncharacterized protein (UPF0147 family)